ncbi:MAG TPA: cytochrome c oxidase accessory protein CcoG [Candidatus Polarisedimenticolaceae bacterium]|nr:cytochrome c oxidase accessory protein CcoG [Candidatus Polarisedimenticolaceae bacterium]
MTTALPPPGRVLATLNEDGTRRWLRPKLSKGAWWKRRRALAGLLVLTFTAIPYLRIGGKPVILLDVVHRRFTLFGTTFLSTDSLLLVLLLVGIFVGIFLLTAVVGRVWCGWACPQTIYMEFLFRPIERLIEGNRARQMRLDREGPDVRRLVKHVVFGIVALFLAHTFLAYFVGVGTLLTWMTEPPSKHVVAFVVVAVVTALILADFAVLREQVCLVACPYGRLQSVLLDRRSLIVAYDTTRGEPRAPLKGRPAGATADCIDCAACVITCPTGIDIRDGLQMECIHCTQCIDACDRVMETIGKPKGLVRYGSRDQLEGKPPRILRPRIVVYPLIMVAVWGGLAYALAHRGTADVTVLRGIGAPYGVLPDGSISNQLRIKVVNRSGETRRYTIAIDGEPEMTLVAPDNPMEVPPGASRTASVFVTAPPSALPNGVRDVRVHVADGADYDEAIPYRLLGPEEAP